MVKGGRKAQLKYWKHYRQIHRDRDRLRKARQGIHYSRVVILGVKVQLRPLTTSLSPRLQPPNLQPPNLQPDQTASSFLRSFVGV
jgi:hypothetical protein